MEDDYQQLLEKYKARIKEEFGEHAVLTPQKITTKEYADFKRELYPARYSFYEKSCNFSENLLKLKADPKTAEPMQKYLDICHLNVTPSGVISFSLEDGLASCAHERAVTQ